MVNVPNTEIEQVQPGRKLHLNKCLCGCPIYNKARQWARQYKYKIPYKDSRMDFFCNYAKQKMSLSFF